MLPEHYKEYLERTKKQASDYFFRPSKFGKTYQELTLDTVKKFLKDSRDSNFKI